MIKKLYNRIKMYFVMRKRLKEMRKNDPFIYK
jgi:hypothetical protein